MTATVDPWAAYNPQPVRPQTPIPAAGAPDPWATYNPQPVAGGGQSIGPMDPTTRMRAAPGSINDSDHAGGVWANLRASLAPDVHDQIKRFAAARGISPERYGVDAQGNIVYADKDGNYTRETPSVFGGNGVVDTLKRGAQWGASLAGPTISNVGGFLGGAAGAVGGPVGAVAGAGAGAAGADLVRQGIDRLAAGENPLDLDYWNAAGQGALNATGTAAGRVVTGMFSRNPLFVAASDRLNALDPQRLAQAEALQRLAADRGVQLTPGQATGLPSLLANERQLGRYQETTNAMHDFIGNQRSVDVPAAVRDEIGQIGTPGAPNYTAAGNLPRAAQDILDRAAPFGPASTTRPTISGLYESALDSGVRPDISPTIDRIDHQLQRVDPQSSIAKQLQATRDLLTQPQEIAGVDAQGNPTTQVVRVPKDDYRGLHSLKMDLDAKIADLNDSIDDKSAKRVAASALSGIMHNDEGTGLTDILAGAHPDYAAGRDMFAKGMQGLQALRESGVGTLAKMTGPDRMAMLDSTFSARASNPDEIRRLRGAFLVSGHKDEWDNSVRAYLDNRLVDAMTPRAANAGGDLGNVSGRYYNSIWADPRQREMITAALGNDPARVDGLDKLMQVLQASSRGLPEGSPTVTDLAASRPGAAVGNALRFAGRALSPDTYMDIGNKLVDGWAALRVPAMRQRMLDAVMSPDGVKQLQQLRMLSPRSEAAVQAAGTFLTKFGINSTGIDSPAPFEAPDRSVQAPSRPAGGQ